MRLIAHRGFAATAPENTIAAVQSAAEYADAVEFDVRRCGSGELVVIHDETVDRVTGGVGAVADSSLEELQSLTVLQSGERVPTLEEMLEVVPPSVEINLEMKELDIAADVLEALRPARHLTAIARLKMGRYREISMPPITTPMPTMRTGSRIDVRLLTVVSTSVS